MARMVRGREGRFPVRGLAFLARGRPLALPGANGAGGRVLCLWRECCGGVRGGSRFGFGFSCEGLAPRAPRGEWGWLACSVFMARVVRGREGRFLVWGLAFLARGWPLALPLANGGGWRVRFLARMVRGREGRFPVRGLAFLARGWPLALPLANGGGWRVRLLWREWCGGVRGGSRFGVWLFLRGAVLGLGGLLGWGVAGVQEGCDVVGGGVAA